MTLNSKILNFFSLYIYGVIIMHLLEVDVVKYANMYVYMEQFMNMHEYIWGLCTQISEIQPYMHIKNDISYPTCLIPRSGRISDIRLYWYKAEISRYRKPVKATTRIMRPPSLEDHKSRTEGYHFNDPGPAVHGGQVLGARY